jgi:hypothetical protein
MEENAQVYAKAPYHCGHRYSNIFLINVDEIAVFLIYLILSASLCPGVYSASDRNEYQKQKNYF